MPQRCPRIAFLSSLPGSCHAPGTADERRGAAEPRQDGGLELLLDTLSPDEREVLRLRIPLGYSIDETARVLGVSPHALRVAQHRALDRLRTALRTAAGDLDGRAPDRPIRPEVR